VTDDVVPVPHGDPGLLGNCETPIAMRDTPPAPTLLNWGAGTPLEQWAGVQVSGEPRRVTGLKFTFRHTDHYLGGCLDPSFAARLDEVSNVKVCAAERAP